MMSVDSYVVMGAHALYVGHVGWMALVAVLQQMHVDGVVEMGQHAGDVMESHTLD